MLYPANQRLKLLSAAVLTCMYCAGANAGGFSLYGESNGTVIGNYAAGIAAEAADASTSWYNPAGLALINRTQLVNSGVGLFLTSRLSGVSTFQTFGPPVATYQQTFSDANGAKDGFVPAFHAALPINDKLTLGFSVVSPFGLTTEWPIESAVRYQALNSELLTITASPALGYRVSDRFAVGAGLDLTYAEVRFNSMAGIPTLAPAFRQVRNYFDSFSYNKGHAYGVGFHLGGMLMLNENHTRIGLNIQSSERLTFHGHSRLTGRLATPGLNLRSPTSVLTASPNNVFYSDDLSSDPLTLPYVVTLSGYHDVNDRLAVLGSVVYFGWSSLKYIQLNNVAGFSATQGPVLLNSHSDENWKNTWRFAVGANYKWTDRFMLRAGVGYDQTPTNDVRRSVRIPDGSRYAVAIGARYAVKQDIDLDIGYSHLFMARQIQINRTDVTNTSSFNVQATGKGIADLVGAQITWYFDGKPEEVKPMK